MVGCGSLHVPFVVSHSLVFHFVINITDNVLNAHWVLVRGAFAFLGSS